MVKRKVVFRKKRQNRLGMFLVLMVVLMLLVVVSLKSAELRQKQETYAARERVLQEQIDAEGWPPVRSSAWDSGTGPVWGAVRM